MNLYQVHGLLQTIAFLVLFPLGALIAYFRNSIGPGWKMFHVGIQLTATLFVFTAVTIVASIKRDKSTEKINKNHRILGRIVVITIVLQLLWAFFGRNVVNWDTWLTIHMLLSATIIIGGITNIVLGSQLIKN